MVFIKSIQRQLGDIKTTLKTQGLRAALKKHGWNFIIFIFIYYLIRDLILYVFIPLGLGLIV